MVGMSHLTSAQHSWPDIAKGGMLCRLLRRATSMRNSFRFGLMLRQLRSIALMHWITRSMIFDRPWPPIGQSRGRLVCQIACFLMRNLLSCRLWHGPHSFLLRTLLLNESTQPVRSQLLQKLLRRLWLPSSCSFPNKSPGFHSGLDCLLGTGPAAPRHA